MKTKRMTRARALSTIHWGFFLAVSLSILFSTSIHIGYASEETEYTVIGSKGSIQVNLTTSDSLIQVTDNMTLQQDRMIVMAEDASLKLKRGTEEEIVLAGPMKGKLGILLVLQKSKETFVKKTLDKIPAATGSEKKVDISTQSAAMTRGAKPHARQMPYIWKVKKTDKTSSNTKKESSEKK